MSAKEKIQKLEEILKSQIDWYKGCEEDDDIDDSYAYDVVEEQFDRSDLSAILNILSN